jgi:hypothetical protein
MDTVRLLKIAIGLVVLGGALAAVARSRTRRKELLLALAAGAGALLAAEALLRSFAPQISEEGRLYEPDAELGWRFGGSRRARVVHRGEVNHVVATNALGFRDAERDLAARHGKRILVLGDSFVSNLAVEADQVFTRLLERRLAGTEVMNFGVNGYGQVQELLLLERWFDRVRPDAVVVLVYVRNDFLDNVDAQWTYARPTVSLDGDGRLVMNPPPADARGARGSRWQIHRQSHLFALFDQSLDQALRRALPNAYPSAERTLCRTAPTAETDRQFAAMTRLIVDIDAFASGKGVPATFVLAPSHVQVYDDLWQAAVGDDARACDRTLPNRRLMALAASRGLRMVDLLPAFVAAGRRDPALYYRYEQHWTPAGNALVADLLARELDGQTRRR